jgi:hypothetical protein
MPDDPAQNLPPPPVSEGKTPQPKVIKFREPNLNYSLSQKLIPQLEKKLNTRVITFYNAPASKISEYHPDLFLDQLKQIGRQEILSLVLITNGGSLHGSYRIASVLREYVKYFQVIIPSRCASGGTMIALAADKIIMTPAGYLTAIDSYHLHELNPKGYDNEPVRISADQIKRIIKFLNEEGPAKNSENQSEGSYRTLFKYLHPLAVAEIDRGSSASFLIASKIMAMHQETFGGMENINRIVSHLINNYPAHGFPIIFSEAKELGLPVEKSDDELSDLLRELVKIYDGATNSTTTHISETHFHFVGYPDIIESLGKRTTYRFSYNKRINPATRRWQVENDYSRWVNILPPEQPGGKVRVLPLDVPESKEAAPIPNSESASPANS